jgi:RNA polymerase sigma factor (sigma-70 family)
MPRKTTGGSQLPRCYGVSGPEAASRSARPHSRVTTTTATKTTRSVLLGGRSPLLRLQSDERLIVLLRAGNDAAFEVVFGRYRTRLLGFCRHMLGSKEDAEDVLQEVFANAYNAILADQRDINVRPWLYRIARNRCLNHLRRPTADASDTMDEHMGAHGRTAADVVHRRADVRHLLEDVQKLAESQRTALLLREIDALSYDQIAEAMETTIPSVKSLLVRARMSLAEAAEARQLSCDDVRRELAEVSEGLKKASPALRRHVRDCEECREYRTQLRKTTTAMALALPIGPLMILKKLALAKLGGAALAGGGGGAAAGDTATGAAGATGAVTAASSAATGVASTAAAGGAASGLASAGGIGLGAVATKAAAGVAVTAVIAGGAVEAKRVAAPDPVKPAVSAPAKVKAAPAVNPTGGASLSGAPATLTQPAQQAPEKPAESSTADPEVAAPDTGTTGEVGATAGGEDDEAALPAEDPPPVTGSDADGQAETGGAAVPALPEPQGTTGATGSSVGTGATGTSAPSP